MDNILFIFLRRLHAPLIVLISVYAISILGFTLIPGVDDQGNPWRMDFFHAFYFVSFMGTTIGFGEIPYAFTGGQRMWATISIYATVISWLYAIGYLLTIIQDPALQDLLTLNRFRRSVRRIREPFYLICGYGDTGNFLVRALSEAGIRSVVVEIDQDRVNYLELAGYNIYVPGLCADASVPDNLLKAGLQSQYCAGVVGLTNEDSVNLKIAITSKLLNPALNTIARAETHDVEKNIASFGTDHIINPFDTFAGRLALALHSPGMYLLYEWMTSVPHEPLREPVFPPRGRWILCGYGRFGKAVHDRLSSEGITTTVIEAMPDKTGTPSDGVVVGRGTEADTLHEADILHAVGLVAGTDDDANNLSIVMTAKKLNPDLFTVMRQNSRANDVIFDAVQSNLIMQRGSIIAHKIFAMITRPVLSDFLRLARRYDDEWANQLISRIGGITGEEAPHVWVLSLTEEIAPAIHQALDRGIEVTINTLTTDPHDYTSQLPVITLLLKRFDDEAEQDILLPSSREPLQAGDELLFCGRYGTQARIEGLVANLNLLEYVLFGEDRPAGTIWRRLPRRESAS
ncbi:MAG: NAD-binding protein [Thiohalophilus sp.]|jgi:Trk K+ transport system NAD-binding subunit